MFNLMTNVKSIMINDAMLMQMADGGGWCDDMLWPGV